ncbi:tetratricopeptide repeat-containing sensor histidine kinase [Flavihumibacter profundi]|uniref:tetratricopeptide repeat-containing sensor histidine kinase n=1 Tax=Flavihumibacter profundi TaxID=2716883 RepID=UPI001CC624DE|nr:tetratricopeptide repeat protein [Flavihumibacter profundi]MBZ5857702.1 tetratricopeptide repeat protein [Flavihumibacter profundi]
MTISLKSYALPAGMLIALFCCLFARSQNIPDSLLNKLNTAPNDSVKARTLLDIGETIEATYTDKSLGYYYEALILSKKIKNNSLLISSWNDVGVCYIELNKMDSALTAFEQAIIYTRLEKNPLREAKVLVNMGNVYLHKKDRVKAIEYYLQSARLWETCADKNNLAGLYANITMLLYEQGEYRKAVEYGTRGYSLAMRIGDDFSGTNALLNLANAYYGLAQFDKAYETLQKAIPMAKRGGDIEQVSTAYDDLGGYFLQKKEYQPALTNFQESYRYSLQLANKFHLCEISSKLATIYHNLNEPDKALKFISQAEKLANEVGARANLNEIYRIRAEIEQSAGNYRQASEYFSKALTLSDSLFKASTSEKVAEVEAQYQNEKKQSEIELLEKDRLAQSLSLKQKSTLNYILTGLLTALLLAGFLGYRNLHHRQLLAKQQEELHKEQILSLEKDKQLVALDSMLKGQEDERSRLAKDLHDGLGGLLSGVKFSLSNMKSNMIITPENMAVFERSLDMIDTSISELRRVAHNMMPEMLTKYGLDEAVKEYCNTINSTRLLSLKYQSVGMDVRLENSTEIIIYRIVQELVNNAMKHARASEVFVQLIKEGPRLNVVVEDNGIGFDSSTMGNNQGAGLVNVKSRVDYLKGQLDIHTAPGKGTLVNIEFNI